MKIGFRKSFLRGILLSLMGAVLLIAFQNCSNKKKEETDVADMPSTAAPAPSPVILPVDCLQNPTDPNCTPSTCTFDGQDLNSGSSVTAYQNSTVPYGSECVSEVRQCANGALSGSFAFANCMVEIPSSCLFDSKTIEHDQSVLAFQNASVPYGSSCVSESRICSNGSLSGSYAYSTCLPSQPSSCLFNGQTLAHEEVTVAFQSSTVPYGTNCQQENRVCNNGALSGSFAFASCNVQAPQSCLFNGQTIAHGQNIDAYQSSTVPFGSSCQKEIRTCDNGILSGQYSFASCNVDSAQSCLFNGQTIAHGQNVEAFSSATVPYGSTCQKETRTCLNGNLSGSYSEASCTVAAAASCAFNGQTVEHSSSVTAFQSSSVPYGSNCVSESRICNNGNLSGSYSYASCAGSPPPTGSCTFNGQLVLNGSSVKAFQAASVPYGNTCIFENRICTDGTLSGTYTFESCSAQAPLNCDFNGTAVTHGSSITAYKTATSSKGTCQSQQRTCSNGSLSGSFKFSSCQ